MGKRRRSFLDAEPQPTPELVASGSGSASASPAPGTPARRSARLAVPWTGSSSRAGADCGRKTRGVTTGRRVWQRLALLLLAHRRRLWLEAPTRRGAVVILDV
jgi:hypothetical protein